MPIAHANGIDIYYETDGNPDDEPLLLVMGFTAQLISWPAEFVKALCDRGFYVIRHDNRDCGLSTKSDGPPPDPAALMGRIAAGEDVSSDVPYTLSTMSDDAFGVLNHLGIETAHIAGASMGGMIVQTMAIEHPERLRSVTSIMSTTGDRSVGQGTPETIAALTAPPAEGRDAILAQGVEANQIISGPLWERDRAVVRLTEAFDRCFHPIGSAFQMAAIFAGGDRTAALKSVDLPFLALHGRSDELISWNGATATAEAVPNADLVVLAQMGHDLPESLVPIIADSIRSIANR